MLEPTERICPAFTLAFRVERCCIGARCAWWEGWTAMSIEDGVESRGLCLLFNLRGLNYLVPEDAQDVGEWEGKED